MEKPTLSLLALACAFAAPAIAHADTLVATLGEPVTEVSHGVSLSVDDGVARFVVRRTFSNGGERHDEADLAIDLPPGASATGLRIRVGERWYDGELMEAVRAANLYLELTGLGPHRPRDPALLSWVWARHLRLNVFPVPPQGTATVEYTLTVPTSYEAGRYSLEYPLREPDAHNLVDPVLTVASWRQGSVSIDDRPVATDQPVALQQRPVPFADSRFATIELGADAMTEVTGRLGHVSLKGAAASRLELDLPPRLSQMPEAPHVVFVVDASRSVGSAGLDTQRLLIEGFLAHVPDASFEIVAYSRYATRVADDFLPADRLGEAWERGESSGALAPSNGSNVDEALALAYQTMKGAKGERYVIAFSDDRLRPSWPAKHSFSTSASDASTTHLLVVGRDEWGGRPRVQRDDDHRLASIALDDGGILSEIIEPSKMEAEALAAELLHLVRPTRLEGVSVEGFDVPTTLMEGSSVRQMDLVDGPAKTRLLGKLWARPYSRTLRHQRNFDRATAAWVFADRLHQALSPDQMMAFALFGRAVSPVTSYLAIEPGVRPSPVGLDRGAAGLGMRGSGRGGGGVGAALGSAIITPPSLSALLADAQKRCAEKHEGHEPATLGLHTTLNEVVDVELNSARTPYAECVEEAAWRLDLTGTEFENFPATSQTATF